jgi:hypothetical protein
MQQVIIWAIGFGCIVFGIGLISAINSRKQSRSKSSTRVVYNQTIEIPVQSTVTHPSAISMAAGGTGNVSVSNGEKNFASIGSNSR